MRFNKGIHNILVERGIASENTAMLFMCFYGEIRQTNMATDSIKCLSPVGVKSLNRFVIYWQAGAKLIRHVRQYNGFVTLNASAIKKRHDMFKGNSGVTCPAPMLNCHKAPAPLQGILGNSLHRSGDGAKSPVLYHINACVFDQI